MWIAKGHTAAGRADLSGLHCHLGHGDIWIQAAARGHVWVLQQPGSVFMSQAHVTTKGHADVFGLEFCQRHNGEWPYPSPV